MNHWYSARPNEIFLDLDSNRAIARALSVLRLAIRKRELKISAVWLYPTPGKSHAHMIIVMKEPWSDLAKVAYSLWLGNDRLRCAYVLERFARGVKHSDLLVAENGEYYRYCDAVCRCKRKHKEKKVTDACQAMQFLLGKARSADYFVRTGVAPPRKKIRVPWGKVSLTQLREWKEVYE